jgi:hypothetical protein
MNDSSIAIKLILLALVAIVLCALCSNYWSHKDERCHPGLLGEKLGDCR